MKKLLIALVSTTILISCTIDNDEILNDSQNLTQQVASEKSNLGMYKGVFTTLDSQYRATVEINLPKANSETAGNELPQAKVKLHTGELYTAYANEIIETDMGTISLSFNSNELSFDLQVGDKGGSAIISNVIFMDKESDIIVIKDSQRAPVTPITGVFNCTVCNGHPKLGQGLTQTFNFILSSPDGTGSIITQSTLGPNTFNGIGFQNNCSNSGNFSTCNLESGDGSTTTTGMTINGNPLTWTGGHIFNNEPSANGNDCSEVSGTWSWQSLNYGVLSGEFVSDNVCFMSLYAEDFQAFDGSGFAPNPTAGQLDSDIFITTGFNGGTLNYGGTQTSGDFARGVDVDGGVGTGGVWAFEQSADSNRFIGVQPGANDFTPGTFDIKVLNNTGSDLSAFMISYDIFANNDQNRDSSFNFSYSTDGVNYTAIGALDFTTPSTSDGLGFISVNRSAIFSQNVASNNFIYLRFTGDDVSGSAARDEIGVDNIVLKGN